jgi:excisionase family DNA binding protein
LLTGNTLTSSRVFVNGNIELDKEFSLSYKGAMRMLTTNEAASLLGVTVQRIHQFINDGRLPAQKLGRDYIINEDDMKLVEDRKPGRPPKAKDKANSKTNKKGSD